jgi:TolB-like protein
MFEAGRVLALVALVASGLAAQAVRAVDFTSGTGDPATRGSGTTPVEADSVADLRPVLAVFDLQGDSPSTAEAGILTELLRSRLAASGNFHLIDRAVTADLHDPHFGAMAQCSDLDCAWRATKLLHADYVVVGKVVKEDKLLVLDLAVVDEERGEVVEKLEYTDGFNQLSAKRIPNAVARLAMFSPAALGPDAADHEGIVPISLARQLRSATDDYVFTKRTAWYLNIAGTVGLVLGNALVQSENQSCRDRYWTAPSSCSDVRFTRGTVVFGVGAVVQALGIARVVETIFVGRDLKELEDRAGQTSVSVIPVYDPRTRSTGVLAKLEF